MAQVPDWHHQADPGGRFDSEIHRRLLGAVANPDEDPIATTEITARLDTDPYIPLGTTAEAEVEAVLVELVGDGLAKETKDGYRMTKAGRELLSAPPPEEGEEE